MNTSSAAPTTTVYYDGACPICSREIAQYRKVQGAERLDFVDVTACDANGLGPGLSRDAALARMHVRRADGSLASGAAAFAEIWQQLPKLAWAGRLAASPIVLPVLELGYRVFLRVRRLWR
ncbi:thiol-disulfide oxidoreductase DCC family protein [Roseomonas sp. CECT 9278]|uniref:thiol-disulfide oxidoreductase DCC family protein n=1 Tax=Roseomonas sp. CECT 9278 TaxID=2845823 RepID=UPI001E4C68DB|nr:DUF393 domain-containing protein [Roseomonas sp. CECT 9278]CAH0128492.1 hypothetical protein ROS9278_00170 [Roseomonas sp. CECT 9278]